MKIRCIAIDDEPIALKQVGNYIERTPYLELVSLCNNAIDALEIINKEKVDLVFADISMPDLSGIDFVKSLQKKIPVIFTTAFSEYAIEGFRVDAIDYLLKPIGYKDFLKAVNKFKELLDKKDDNQDKSHPDHIFVKSGYKLVRIEISDIKYIESMHEYIRIHLINEKPVMTLGSMKSIEELLPPLNFLRVHRSYIVNTDKIKIVERNRIVFDKEVYIPISDQYKSKFQDFINRNSIA
ncbi:MAG TPA: LytTR family DNA-binding domain-containing protein [Bacteroidales bacterium]|nr:LytTR family DNA-binding domain-containing protein [Bacteroidales bacterium]